MARVTKIAFTLYPVTDMKRARAFYEQGLGLVMSDDFEGRWIEYALGDGVFAICDMFPPEHMRPATDAGGCIAFEVDDVEAMVEQLVAKGARVLQPPMTTPVCKLAVLADPEGNAVTVHHVTA